MAPYQQQPPVAQSWDRWQNQHAGSDYSMMDHMVTYDPRTVPTTTSLQRPAMTTQYNMPTSYADSPVTPMSASPYGSQGHFGDYQAYAYQTPTAPTNFAQLPLRSATRPMAPPTPPLDDERGLRLNDGRTANTVKSSYRRSPRRSVSVVKSEAGEEKKEIKTCPVLIKEDHTLQYESKKLVDVLLRKAASKRTTDAKGGVSTPESVASPAAAVEENNTGRQKPFRKHACKICDRRFFQAAQLQTHMRSHTGEKPFGCPICGRHVSQPGNLKAHLRRHSKEKPFSCDQCDLRFANRGGLKVHIKNKHEQAPKHNCPLKGCVKTFTTIGNMKGHIEKFHVSELNYYFKLLDDNEFDTLPQEPREILEILLRVYKNSNRGIKGRGPDSEFEKEEKEEKKRPAVQRRAAHQEMTPVSPDANSTVHEYRQYYDQQQQHQYHHVLPHPAQQTPQQSAGYLQLPVHQTQHSTMYHGLPQPGTYSMGWTQGSQYH